MFPHTIFPPQGLPVIIIPGPGAPTIGVWITPLDSFIGSPLPAIQEVLSPLVLDPFIGSPLPAIQEVLSPLVGPIVGAPMPV